MCHRTRSSVLHCLARYHCYSLVSYTFILRFSSNAGSCFSGERSSSRTPNPLRFEIIKPITTFIISPFFIPPPTGVLSTSSNNSRRPGSHFHSSPALSSTASSITVMATPPWATVPVILSGILTCAPSVLVPSILPSFSSVVPSSFAMRLFSAPITPQRLAFSPMAAPSSVQPPTAGAFGVRYSASWMWDNWFYIYSTVYVIVTCVRMSHDYVSS